MSSAARMSANACLRSGCRISGLTTKRVNGSSPGPACRPDALTRTNRSAPAAVIAVVMLRVPSAQTVVGARPSRVPRADRTASRPLTASSIAAGSMTSAWTTSAHARRSDGRRAVSRTTAVTSCPASSARRTVRTPVPPVAPKIVSLIGSP